MNRRNFVFTSSGAGLGSFAVSGLVEATEGRESPYAGSGLATGELKPLRYDEIPGFLSAKQISLHHTSHYGGALRAFTAVERRFEKSFARAQAVESAAFQRMKQLQSSRGNSVILHEIYFDGMTPLPNRRPSDCVRKAIEARFGSVEKWVTDFVASAKGAAGWAMLVVHPVNGRLYNVVSDEHAQGPLWLSVPLVVIDTYEHAFYVDYANKKADYVERFMSFIDWTGVHERFKSL